MIVIEAAGNGNVDLDGIPELKPHGPGFKESRAIIVGGSHSALDPTGVGHDRWVLPTPPPPPFPTPGSNWGSRVDCYAYAENVVTAGEPLNPPTALLGGTGPNDSYRSDFGGTSAAAAIIAGAALVVQGMHKAVKGAPLDPVNMRKALSTFGTPQGPKTAARKIGVMPNLKKIAGALDLVGGAPAPPTNVRIQR
jgi:hypothetical protein